MNAEWLGRLRKQSEKLSANPIAMIASLAMCLRYSFGMGTEADMIERAISATLDKGLRTKDIAEKGVKFVTSREMGDAIVKELSATH